MAAIVDEKPVDITSDVAGEQTENGGAAKNKRRNNRAKKDKDASAPVSSNPESPASDEAAAPGDIARAAKCKQCNKRVDALFRDPSDSKLYCAPCWKKYYKSAPPDTARFEQGAPKQPRELPDEIVRQPIAGETADIDEYYESALRDGEPRVFVDDQKIAWSVLLKGIEDKFAMEVLQLIIHNDSCVVFRRTAHINLGADCAKETYEDYVQLKDARKAFERQFFDLTANHFHDVKGSVTRFINRGRFTLLADVKAARRAENDLNREAREDAQRKTMEARNAAIVATTTAELMKELKEEAEAAQRGREKAALLAAPHASPKSSSNAMLSTDSGPAEPPCTPADAFGAQSNESDPLHPYPPPPAEPRNTVLPPSSKVATQALASAGVLQSANTSAGVSPQASPVIGMEQSRSGLLSDSGPAEPPCTPAVQPGETPEPGAAAVVLERRPPPKAEPKNTILPPPNASRAPQPETLHPAAHTTPPAATAPPAPTHSAAASTITKPPQTQPTVHAAQQPKAKTFDVDEEKPASNNLPLIVGAVAAIAALGIAVAVLGKKKKQ